MSSNPTMAAVRVKMLAEHQRQACHALDTGKGILSRAECSFLHRVREEIAITAKQRRYLNDIDARLKWEISLVHI
ncbi:hypothetical protein [Sphingopyxis sp.]|uniref:hypothetical protein n=1 Tax=Sphingopyxis sp. TaxID=1908224 RepID=UPI003D6C7264